MQFRFDNSLGPGEEYYLFKTDFGKVKIILKTRQNKRQLLLRLLLLLLCITFCPSEVARDDSTRIRLIIIVEMKS